MEESQRHHAESNKPGIWYMVPFVQHFWKGDKSQISDPVAGIVGYDWLQWGTRNVEEMGIFSILTMVVATQMQTFVKTQWITYLKWVQFIVFKLCFNEVLVFFYKYIWEALI